MIPSPSLVSKSKTSSFLESSDSSSFASNARVTCNSSSSSSTSSFSTSSDDTTPAAKRPAIKKGGIPSVKISRKLNLTCSAKRPLAVASDGKSFVPSSKLLTVHRIDSKHSFCKALVTTHERYGHVSPKKVISFTKKGRVHSSTIFVRGALDFKV